VSLIIGLLIALFFNRLLGDLENQTDRTESKLARAQKRMDYFLTKAEREYPLAALPRAWPYGIDEHCQQKVDGVSISLLQYWVC
jgi:hypothetical protein